MDETSALVKNFLFEKQIRKRRFVGAFLKLAKSKWPTPKPGTSVSAPQSWTPQDVVDKVLDLLNPTCRDVLIDLGSGDGRWCVSFAKRCGGIAQGYELEDSLVARARETVSQQGLTTVSIFQQDLTTADVSQATVVIVYGGRICNEALSKTLPKKLKDGAKVVSFRFRFRDWKPQTCERVGDSTVYVYEAPFSFNRAKQ